MESKTIILVAVHELNGLYTSKFTVTESNITFEYNNFEEFVEGKTQEEIEKLEEDGFNVLSTNEEGVLEIIDELIELLK